MDIFTKTLPKKIATKQTGIYYKEIQKTVIDDNGKTKTSIVDKMFYIRYKDGNKKDIWVSIGKYSEGIREAYCKSKRIQLLNQLKFGEQPKIIKKKIAKKKKISLDDIFQLYKEYKQTTKKDFSKIEQKYKANIYKWFSDMDIDFITTDEIVKFKQYLHNKNLAIGTINNNITFLGTLFNFAIEEEKYNKNNPIKSKKLKLQKVDNARERYLSVPEINKLLDTMQDNKTLTLFINLSLTTGGRLETILNIQKKDINIDAQTITLKDLKNNSTYTSFLTHNIIELLEDEFEKFSPNHFIIGGKITKYSTRTLQHHLKCILDELFNKGLDTKDAKNRVVIHTLRHTFASHLAINGTPIFTIQKLMNHSDIKMTMRYAKLAPDSGKIAVQELYK